MSEKEEYIVPQGMTKKTVLGMSFVVPEDTPDELVVAIAEGMVQAGNMVFDPVTNTIKPNPDRQDDGKLQGMSMRVDDSGNVVNAKPLPDDDVKKFFGVEKLTGYTTMPKPKKGK